MSRRVTDWLRSESLPRNAYELLGHPLLDPDRDALLQTLRSANRELLDYQSHPEPAVSKRAMFLLTELGRHRGILEDAAKHQAYVEEVAKTLRDQFVAERGPLALHAGNDLQTWLATAHKVPPVDATRIATLVRGNIQPPQVLPKRDKSKFGAFGSPVPDEPMVAELVEIIEPPPPTPVVVGVYDLSDAPVPLPVARPKRRPDHMEPVDLAPRPRVKPRKKSESSLGVPLAIASGVLMLLAIVTAVVIVVTGEPEKVRNENPPEQPSPPVIPPDPPVDPPVVSPKPPVDSPVIPPKPPVDPPVVPPKKPPVNPPVVPPKPPVNPPVIPPKPPVDPPPTVPAKKEPQFNERDWEKAVGDNKNFLVTDIVVRVQSIALHPLTNDANKDVSKPVLVVWLEAHNKGKSTHNYLRLIESTANDSSTYEYCELRENADRGLILKRPFWLKPDMQVRELPNWYPNNQPNREILPNAGVRIPIAFEAPTPPLAKEYSLKVKAVRLVGERGNTNRENDYGMYHLQVKKEHWKP